MDSEGSGGRKSTPRDSAGCAESAAAEFIERLRGYRGRRQRDLSISRQVAHLRHEADRVQRKLGALIDLWDATVPRHILPHTVLTGYRGGTLTVTVNSSSTAYELDRLLREGLLAELRQGFRGTLTRVRVRIGQPESTKDSRSAGL